jgi:uncharacterized SAM-binding protein YcdF (DUF218 family)
MIDLFLLKKALATLILPPNGPFLLTAVGLALLTWKPRLGRMFSLVGFLTLFAACLPVVATALVRVLDDGPVFDIDRLSGAEAIVILGGGVRRDAVEYGGDTLGRLTLERVRYGAWVARKTQLPVLVSGGAVYDGSPEADLMKRCLEDEFGVAVKWAEPRSRNTHENAVFSAAILARAGIRRIVLIAHSFDMRRAKAEFSDTGLQVIPAATGIPSREPSHWVDWVPSVSALQLSYWALYELLANAVRGVNS